MRHSLLKGISAQIVSAAVSILFSPLLCNLQWHNEVGMSIKQSTALLLARSSRKIQSGFHGLGVIIFDSYDMATHLDVEISAAMK